MDRLASGQEEDIAGFLLAQLEFATECLRKLLQKIEKGEALPPPPPPVDPQIGPFSLMRLGEESWLLQWCRERLQAARRNNGQLPPDPDPSERERLIKDAEQSINEADAIR